MPSAPKTIAPLLLALLCAGLAIGLLATATADASDGTRTYRVRPGETLGRIAAEQLGSADRVDEILALNPTIRDPNQIRVGQTLRLPDDSGAGDRPRDRDADTDADSGADPDDWRADWREQAAALGILGAGLGIIFLIVVCSVVVEFVLSLFVGALLLWLGATIASIEKRDFGPVFMANLFGSLWWGVALIAGLALALLVPLPDLVRGLLALASILVLPWIAYVATVKARLETTAVRATVASLIAGILPIIFSVVVFLGAVAMNLLPFVFFL